MIRSRFRRGPERRFRVDLTVHRLDHIPDIHRHLYVYWRARRAEPSDGRTRSHPVETGNFVQWNDKAQFLVTILSDPTDPTILQESRLELQLRSEKRARWVGTTTYQVEGNVSIDLSEVAAVLSLSRNFLVHDTKLNITLKLSLRVTHESGDKIFRTRTLPSFQHGYTQAYRGTPASSTPPSVSNNSDNFNAAIGTHSLTATDDDTTSSRLAIALDTTPLADRTISADKLFQLSSLATGASALQSTSSSPSPNAIGWTHPNSSGGSFPSRSASAMTSLVIPEYTIEGLERTTGQTSDPLFNEIESPMSILERIIPNPDISQRQIYEQMFQERIRDKWPDYIINSRKNAAQVVNEVYTAVCQEDGIGIGNPPKAVVKKRQMSTNNPVEVDKKQALDVDFLLESRNVDGDDTPLAGPVTQMLLTRRPSGRGSHLSIKSSSMSEIAELAKRGAPEF